MKICVVFFILLFLTVAFGDESPNAALPLLKEIQKTYPKWSETLYKESNWKMYEKKTPQGRPLIYYVCGEENKNTTLFLSSIHGDEVTPVYFGLRLVSWVKGEPDLCRDRRIIIAPMINPDGALGKKITRTNGHGVDLNRNFPTSDFKELALARWKKEGKSDPRRFPGEEPGSEVETQFQMWLIETFKPNKILSVHSPLNFLDYDGPEDAAVQNFTKEYLDSCQKLKLAVRKASGTYKFLKFGYFTGSLGHYAGEERGIPTITLELPTTDASHAKQYFEMLKKGMRALITHEIVLTSNSSKSENQKE